MSYLVDTNVLSELRRREPNTNVVRWLERRPATTLYLSVLTLGELRKGIEGLPEGTRKRTLLDWLEVELPRFFAGRVLSAATLVASVSRCWYCRIQVRRRLALMPCRKAKPATETPGRRAASISSRLAAGS